MRPLSSEPKLITSALRSGDDVQVTTRDGRVFELTVKEITEQSISGEKERVDVSDIVKIDRRELSVGKTAVMAAAIAVTAILISGILLIASMYRSGL
jgi:hypothetical protein